MSNPFIATEQEISAGVVYFSPKKLELFGIVDRKQYQKLTGQQALACSKDRELKRWKDDAALLLPADSLVPYLALSTKMVNGKTVAQMVELKLPASEAASVNLPGEYIYSAWNPAPTAAIMQNTLKLSQTQALSPWSVCLKAEADALLAELKADLGYPMTLKEMALLSEGSNWRYVYPNDDPRRVYVITIQAPSIEPLPYNAGLLMRRKYEKGVGSPGKWFYEDGTGVKWAAEKQFAGEGLSEVPVPCRALRANEEFHANMFGLQVHVKEPAAVPPTTESAETAKKLDQILEGVNAIRKVFGG